MLTTNSLRKLIFSVALFGLTITSDAALSSATLHNSQQFLETRAIAPATTVETFGFDPNYKLSLSNPVQDKNFYLLSLFQRNPDLRRLLSNDRVLHELTHKKAEALKKAANCGDVRCFDELIRFDPTVIDQVANALQALAEKPQFKLFARTDLRRSGVFIRYANESGAQMLVSAWKDAANAINRIISVYGLGKDPKYKDVDRVSFDVSTEAYRNLIKAKITEIKLLREPLFFEPTLEFALKLLEINRRDEAGRYEPLEQGENKAAVQNLSRIKWRDYPYSFILVLGSGGQDLSTRLSPIGAQRTEVAAQLFLEHKAPLLIVSGGFVHPLQTPYCEAIEMKRYLMNKYKIPEASILVEPHARHTTTNFRNAARLAFRYRIPAERALVTSSPDHITYSLGEEFHTRNRNELGYFPIDYIKRVSPTEAEFRPSIMSLFFDASDPLDP